MAWAAPAAKAGLRRAGKAVSVGKEQQLASHDLGGRITVVPEIDMLRLCLDPGGASGVAGSARAAWKTDFHSESVILCIK